MQNPHFHIWNCRKVCGKSGLKKASPINIFIGGLVSHTWKGMKVQEKVTVQKVDNKDRKLEKLRKAEDHEKKY